MPLHLREHLVVIKRAAHGLELPYGRDTVFLVAILGSDEQSSTTNKLVVALVDDTARAVPIEKVYSEEQGLRQKLEGGMGFDEEVEKIWSHEPLDFGLDVNRVDIR